MLIMIVSFIVMAAACVTDSPFCAACSLRLSLSLSLSLSLRFNGHSEFILHSWCLLKQMMMEVVVTDSWSYRSCKAPYKSLPLTNQHQVCFTGRMPFLSPNHQRQSTAVYISVNVKGKVDHASLRERRRVLISLS